jgi:hypothetical protein
MTGEYPPQVVAAGHGGSIRGRADCLESRDGRAPLMAFIDGHRRRAPIPLGVFVVLVLFRSLESFYMALNLVEVRRGPKLDLARAFPRNDVSRFRDADYPPVGSCCSSQPAETLVVFASISSIGSLLLGCAAA